MKKTNLYALSAALLFAATSAFAGSATYGISGIKMTGDPAPDGTPGKVMEINPTKVHFGGSRLQGLEAGTADSDAVNVKQLKDRVKYFGVGTSPDQNEWYWKRESGSTQPPEFAMILPDDSNQFRDPAHNVDGGGAAKGGSIAIGERAWARTGLNVAIGYNSEAQLRGTALGASAKAQDGSVALGFQAYANGGKSLAVGRDASAHSSKSIAIGYGATAGAGYRYDRRKETTGGADGLAIGYKAHASHFSIAIGEEAFGGNFSLSLGNKAQAQWSAMALGDNTEAISNGSVALGYASHATRPQGVQGYVPSGEKNLYKLLGIEKAYEARVKPYEEKLAEYKKVKDAYNAATKAEEANNKILMLYKNSPNAAEAKQAEEAEAKAKELHDTWAKAADERNKFEAANPQIRQLARMVDNTFVAWKGTYGAVSVGWLEAGMTRQIIGVAAGTADTDAVNVAQLKNAVAKAKKDLIAVTGMSAEDVEALTNPKTPAEGEQPTKPKTLVERINEKGTGTPTPTPAEGKIAKGETGAVSGGTVFDAIEKLKKELGQGGKGAGAGTITDGKGNSTSLQPGTILVGKDGLNGKDRITATLTPEALVFAGKDGKDGSATYGRDGLTITGPAGANGEPGRTVIIHHDKIDMGGNRVQNVADGIEPTDAVNKGQLDALRNELSSGKLSTAAVKGLEEKSNRGDAMGAALAALKPVDFNPLKPNQFMAGYGNVAGYSALALGLGSYSDDGDTFVHAGLAYGGKSNLSFNAGVSIQFGEDLQYKALKGTKVVDTTAPAGVGQLKAMADKLAQQDQTIATQNERLASQEATIAAQGQKIQALEKQLQQLLNQKN